MKPRAIDLFCGCGGLTEGLKQAGFDVIGAVEINKIAMESYKGNHQEVKNFWEMDIELLTAEKVMNDCKIEEGELDLLAGCPPCQGFSTLTTKNGAKDSDDVRNDLVFEYLRFVRELKPKAIMMENVPALAKDRRMKQVLKELKELGYYVDEKTVQVQDASDFRVPQRRKRMILMTGKHGPIPETPKCSDKKTVEDVIGNYAETAGISGDPLHDYPERRTEKVKDIIRKIPHNGGSRRDLPEEDQLECHKKCDGFKDVYGRMKWEDVAPTMTSGCTNPSKGRFLHPEKNRTITLREAALLQTFPPSYFISLKGGKQAASLMIGNALPPEFIRRHAVTIRDYLLRD